MARRTKDVPIPMDPEGTEDTRKNRDAGKVFRLTEMPASQAERWAMRAILAMVGRGAQIPDDIAGAGFAGLAALGPQAMTLMDFDTAEVLMAEMMDCVQIMPDPREPRVVRGLLEDDIEEVSTRLKLRMEIFALHVGFSLADLQSRLKSAPSPQA